MSRRAIKIAAGIVISLVLLCLAFYRMNINEFIAAIKGINLYALLLCIFFFCASCIVRAYMWSITTSSVGRIGFSRLFGGVMIGYMINNILPLRAGELYRAYYLASSSGSSKTYILSTVFIERILDIFSLGLLLIVGLFYGVHGLSLKGAKIALAIWGLMVAIMLIFLLNINRLRMLKDRIVFIPEKVLRILSNFFAPLAQLNQSKRILYLLLLSLVVWTLNYCAVLALIFEVVAVKFEAAALLFLFINLGLLIPSSPGALGVMQVAFWMALSQFGVPKEQALALSFAYHVGAYLLTISLGLPYFLKSRMRLNSVVQDI